MNINNISAVIKNHDEEDDENDVEDSLSAM